MTEPNLYQRIRYKWHWVALRGVVLVPIFLIGKPIGILYHALDNLFEFLYYKLPNPEICDKVEFHQLSKRQQKNLRKLWTRMNRPLPKEMQ